MQASQSSVRIDVHRIDIQGNTLVATPELAALINDLQGRTATLGDLQQGATRLTRLYQDRGYPLAYAYLPAQTVKDGVVTLTVVEPRYDHIAIESSRLKPAQAAKSLGLSSGDFIEQGPLDRGLLLLNQTPGVRVAGTLVPGAQPGTSSLDVKLSDTPLLRASLTADNSGSNSTGRVRGLANVSLDNPFGYGSQIAVNGMTTEGDLLHSGGINLLSPDLDHGLRASLYGSHTAYRLGGDFAALGESGQADQCGISLSYPVLLAPGRLVNARLDLLTDRFREESASVGLDHRSHDSLARLTLNGALADAGGMTSGGLSLSSGDLSLDSSQLQQADATGPNTAGQFWVGQAQLQRDQNLPSQFHLQASLSGQLASKNLDGSEKFYLGGPTGVMSAPVSALGGDAGALVRLRLGHDLPVGLPGNLEGALLAQAGEVWTNHSSYAGATDPNRQHLAAAGVELSYRWTRLTAQVDYVHRIGNPAATSPDTKQALWASLRCDL